MLPIGWYTIYRVHMNHIFIADKDIRQVYSLFLMQL